MKNKEKDFRNCDKSRLRFAKRDSLVCRSRMLQDIRMTIDDEIEILSSGLYSGATLPVYHVTERDYIYD